MSLPRQAWRLGFSLCAAAPYPLDAADIFSAIYGEPEDGGPDWANKVIDTRIWIVRAALSRLDIEIPRRQAGLLRAFDRLPPPASIAGDFLPSIPKGGQLAGRVTTPGLFQSHSYQKSTRDLPARNRDGHHLSDPFVSRVVVAGHAPIMEQTQWNSRGAHQAEQLRGNQCPR